MTVGTPVTSRSTPAQTSRSPRVKTRRPRSVLTLGLFASVGVLIVVVVASI